MNNQSGQTRRRIPRWAIIAGTAIVLLILLARCGGGGIDMSTATCESLIPHVIEMSEDKELKILEITNPRERQSMRIGEIACDGSAEWSQGEGTITYGAHVSEGGSVMIEYKQD